MKESIKVENIENDEETRQTKEDDMAHDVVAKDNVAYGMAMYLET